MKKISILSLILICTLFVACKKSAPEANVQGSSEQSAIPQIAATPVAQAVEQTQQQRELAEKQSKLDYATMEDKYINDPRAQWANFAKATSTFGDEDGKTPSDGNLAINMKGQTDGRNWTNNRIDMGFDYVELSYDKPVAASEVRVVFTNGKGVEAITKLELQDTEGKWNTVWSGISDIKPDERGGRTWFVRNFGKTTYKTKGVKITIANNVQRGYKEIDAVQIVGD
jgi:hypothetical protein